MVSSATFIALRIAIESAMQFSNHCMCHRMRVGLSFRVRRNEETNSHVKLTVMVLSKPTQSMTMSGPSAKTAFNAATVSLADVACDWSSAYFAPSCFATGRLSGRMSVMATLLAEKAFAAARTISPAIPPTQATIMILSIVTMALPAIEAIMVPNNIYNI